MRRAVPRVKAITEKPGRGRRGALAIGLVGLLALLLAACGGSGGTTTSSGGTSTGTATEATPASSTEGGGEITTEDLVKAASPSNEALEEGAGANWPIVGGDLSNSRYSSLEGINTENASKLHLVWQGSYSEKLDTKALEEESSPLVNEGVMFMVTPEDNLVAVDGATGKKLWEWKAEVSEEENRTQPPTGVQGLAVGEGKVFLETNAGKVVGIDVKTGKEVWSDLVALGETRPRRQVFAC